MATAEEDKEAIISIVREMAESMTGAQSTRHWAADVLWFDIPPFASRGVAPARKLFDDTFANFESCTVDILELDATVNGDMGIVCTVQSTNIVLKSGGTRHVMARQTDCFERRDNGWELIHQHASVPAGGEWDGKITTTQGLNYDATSLPTERILSKTAALDIFSDESIAYALGLARAGVPIELHVRPGAPHGFERFVPDADVARRAMADRVRALASI